MNTIKISELRSSKTYELMQNECSTIIGGDTLDDIGKAVGIASGLVGLGRSIGLFGSGEPKQNIITTDRNDPRIQELMKIYPQAEGYAVVDRI